MKVSLYFKEWNTDSPELLLQQATERSSSVVFSTSFGKEDQVITYLIKNGNLPISIFTLDTGRLFPETYEVYNRTINKYQLPIQAFAPNHSEVEELLRKKGPLSFYESVENRKECCAIRKLDPLKRALESAEIWVTGLRKEQSPNRQEMEQVEWDSVNNILKIHPLFQWTGEQVNQFIADHRIPINALHDHGFPSIGCQPCTRAVNKGEDERAGRWWWEDSKKECGLHQTK
jgi:phosphoadenosine phosphosulfate reductase